MMSETKETNKKMMTKHNSKITKLSRKYKYNTKFDFKCHNEINVIPNIPDCRQNF